MKFSIITISLNAVETINETIASIENQTFSDFEHIIVDGGSIDGTKEIIEAYTKRNNNARVVYVEPEGISHAMNEGIKAAHGTYIMHIHADDALHDNTVLADIDLFLQAHPVDWMYGGISVINEKGNESGTFPNKSLFHATSRNLVKSWLLQLYNYIPHQAVAIKKSVFDQYGMFDETLTSGMDPDVWLRLRKKTSWMYMPRIIAKFRLHKGSQTGSTEKQKENRDNFEVVQKRHLGSITMLCAKIVRKLIDIKQYE